MVLASTIAVPTMIFPCGYGLCQNQPEFAPAGRANRIDAVTDFAALIVTVQVVSDTVWHPLQPAKVEPAPAAASSVTTVPDTNVSEQSEPQAIPAGSDVTLPLPVPSFIT